MNENKLENQVKTEQHNTGSDRKLLGLSGGNRRFDELLLRHLVLNKLQRAQTSPNDANKGHRV